MNIHPILVHFPIAILSIYAVMELLRFKKLQQMPGWFYAKAFTAIVGMLAACAAFASGPEERGSNIDATFLHIRDLHSTWALITLTIFIVIAVRYLIELLQRNPKASAWFTDAAWSTKLWSFLGALKRILANPVVAVILALAGLVAITITGGLGGSLVYGPDVDPIVSLIYKFIVR